MAQKVLIWFQKELRTHDNSVLDWIESHACAALGIWIVPENLSTIQKYFTLKSVLEFKQNLKSRGLELLILEGDPRQIVPRITEFINAERVITGSAYNFRDLQKIVAVEEQLNGKKIFQIPSSTLIHPEDIPFKITEMPQVFSKFRRLVEKSWKIRPLSAKSKLQIEGIQLSDIIDLKLFDESSLEKIKPPYSLEPGESAALEHLQDYIWKQKAISTYKETRNGMIEKFDSSKISPWLALGCLSAKYAYYQVKEYEETHGANESTEWFIQELLWRDYFKFLALKIQDRLFQVNGLENSFQNWRRDQKVFQQWKDGFTGSAFVDANMIELAQTGWMSNRGRQNVASYLAKTLNLDWTWGAEYFERTLIDFDVESNWGNWLYLSGQGTDPRDRIFNVDRQAEFYDPQGEYQKLWLSKRKGQ